MEAFIIGSKGAGNNSGNTTTVESYGATKTELFSATDNYAYESGTNPNGINGNNRMIYELTDDFDNYDYLIFSVLRHYGGMTYVNQNLVYGFHDQLSYIYSKEQLNAVYEQQDSDYPHKVILVPGFTAAVNEWKRLVFVEGDKKKLRISHFISNNVNINNSTDVGSQGNFFIIDKIHGIKLNTLIEPNNSNNSNNTNNSDNSNLSNIKTLKWTGTGTTTNTVIFPNRPLVIVGIWGEGTAATDSISWQSQMFGIGQIYPYDYVSSSQKGTGQSNVSWNSMNNSMTLSHAEAAGCANKNGVTYTCLYIT